MPNAARSIVKKTAVKKTVKQPVNKKKKRIASKIVKKKPYIELITALISIPALITIMLVNLNTLNNLNPQPTPTPDPKGVQGGGFFAAPVGTEVPAEPSDSLNQSACVKDLGPVSIASPGENDTVTDNPVIINIEYDDTEYCGAAWSYRINGGSWSGYDDRSVALYNLPQGQVAFDLRVKSIVISEESNLTRRFIYKGGGTVLIPDPQSSGSAN